MKVIQTVQSLAPGSTDGPTDIRYYSGQSLPEAISAMVQAAVAYADDPDWVRVVSVRLEF